MPPGNARAQPPIGDDRYSNSWEYKYDKDGHLIEQLRYNNRGVADFQTRYEYRGNVRKEVGCNVPCDYTPRPKVVTLDENGLEIKTEYIGKDGIGEPEGITNFKYLDFDSQGNWTKREATGTIRDSRDESKPIHNFEYRTFTYY